MGILRETEKIYYVAQQVKAIAYSLFAWEEGRYRIHFNDRAAARGDQGRHRPGAPHRARREEALPAGAAGAPALAETTARPHAAARLRLHEVELEPWEAQLLPHVDGTRSVRELVALSGKPEAVVRASLWALVALEILEKRSGPQSRGRAGGSTWSWRRARACSRSDPAAVGLDDPPWR